MTIREVLVNPSQKQTGLMLPMTTATQAVKEAEVLTDIVVRSVTKTLRMNSRPQTSGGLVRRVGEADITGVEVDILGELPVPVTITTEKGFDLKLNRNVPSDMNFQSRRVVDYMADIGNV
jgi:hypothetical protein